MTFAEHALVVLTADLPEHRLCIGDLGTIVHRYDARTVEVEFTTAAGETLAVVTLPVTSLRLAAARDVASVRNA